MESLSFLVFVSTNILNLGTRIAIGIAWINSQGKAQYTQIGEVIRNAYNLNKDSGELIERLTNAVSVYVLNQSMGYMDYLRKESE